MSDIPTVTYYAYDDDRYIGQFSGEDSAVLAFIAGKGWTAGPAPLASDRDLWASIVDQAVQPGNDADTLGSGDAADGYVLTADGAGGAAWEVQSGGGASSLADLSDVDASVATPSDGNILVYRSAGSDWVLEAKPAAGSNPAAADITDATADGIALITSADANPFTNADESKLDGIASGAEVNAVDSVNAQTGAVSLDADDISDAATTNKFTTASDISKLAGIEAGADVTDTANVTAAGALMDGELTSLSGIKTLTVPDSTTISTFGASLVDDASAATARTTLGLGTAATTASTAYATAAQGSTADSAVQPGDDADTLGSGAATDGQVLTADGAGGAAWESVSGGVSDGDKGDITVSGSGATWTIDNGVVTAAKISATGTPSSSTFLRGDGAWAAPAGGGGGDLLAANNLSDLDNFATARTNLGVAIGTDVQAYDADTAKTDVAQTFTAAQGTTITALTDGASIATDASLSNAFSVTLGGNRTLANPTNIVAGRTYVWIVTQDGTGSRTLAYGSYFKWAGGTAPTLTTTASAIDRIVAFAKSTTELIANAELDFS